jgi:hypothetical protein
MRKHDLKTVEFFDRPGQPGAANWRITSPHMSETLCNAGFISQIFRISALQIDAVRTLALIMPITKTQNRLQESSVVEFEFRARKFHCTINFKFIMAKHR